MARFLARLFITAFGLWMADMLLEGISFNTVGALWLAALLLGFVNAVIRPIVIFLTFPITVLTLGLFLFVVNGAMVLLVGRVMPSFVIDGLGAGILASVIVGLTSWAANSLIRDKKKKARGWGSRSRQIERD